MGSFTPVYSGENYGWTKQLAIIGWTICIMAMHLGIDRLKGGASPLYIVRVTDHFDSLDAHPSKLVVLLYPHLDIGYIPGIRWYTVVYVFNIPLYPLFLLFKSWESLISLTKLPSLTIAHVFVGCIPFSHYIPYILRWFNPNNSLEFH